MADRSLSYGFVVDVIARLKNSGIGNLGMVTNPPGVQMITRVQDRGEHVLSAGTALAVNAFFVAMILAGMVSEPPEQPEVVMATMVELPRIGETPPDPKALPRSSNHRLLLRRRPMR